MSDERRDGAWTQGTRPALGAGSRRIRCAVPEEGAVTGGATERTGGIA
ncbi:hypothetical protein [Kineococcus rhizosphaerae]|uniref:Uncharacterized protein n=1 Tax=Kineococcus rhizosphaerae TaxID=559628 RepID=A0A2T0R093_9ACTN|nr:hypothetical protein [Kineococcus rhizosphaerae]PRY12525.1 hypothetical protein CLV37_11085 [Kineococcus rhizosphaerae]